MAGHSHWANIQRSKSKTDKKRGKIFSKHSKLIISAAKQGGADPDQNLRLRYAIDRARADNMPNQSIERSIAKGAGGSEGDEFEEILYEGYGPGGVALLIEALTDNRNRTAPDLRYILDRKGGTLGTSGSVAWNFERKAAFVLSRQGVAEDELFEFALENGADDVSTEEDGIFGVTADPTAFHTLRTALEARGFPIEDAALRYIPKNTVEVDADTGKKLLELIEALEDNDDIQGVHANAEFLDN
ncbi:MAG TPA: YebC/PmpR family DNA-binding transcriptional regulator [Planctomycetota bacterium]